MSAEAERKQAVENPAEPGPAPEALAEPPAVERAVAWVDLGAVAANCRRLRSLIARGAELCAVVKADGYGHGAAECARAALAGGATWLAVATGDEAEALRANGIDARLIVLGALSAADARAAARADADVVAWDPRFLDRLRAAASEARNALRVHVKLDTGMGRLGTKDVDEAHLLCERVAADDKLVLAGVMTHFATADEPGDDHFPAQLRAFGEFASAARAAHPNLVVHAANSAATFRDPGSHFDLVRCGVAVYGLDPFHDDGVARGLEPALELRSYVAAVKRFRSGESAGYGRHWRAGEETWVGVLPIGYGDGVRRALAGRSHVLVGARRRPLVGAVSMDSLTVDLGAERGVEPGEAAVLIGTQGEERVTCEELARRMETISYEIVCGLSPRVKRRYRGP